MILRYFAKLKQVPNGIVITFPDVPGCFTCAFTRDEIESLSREIMSLTFHGHRPDELPRMSGADEIELEEGQELILIETEMALENGLLKSLIPTDLI